MMRKFFLFFILTCIPFVGISAQEIQKFVQKFFIPYEKNSPNVPNIINDFLLKDGFTSIDGITYNGEFNGCCIKENWKEYFTYGCKLIPKVVNGRVILEYTALSFVDKKLICDGSNKITTRGISPDTYIEDLEEAIENQEERLEDYICKGKYACKPGLAPLMDFIVHDSSISYYKVIQSESGLSAAELYRIVENYFTYAYNSGKAVIQNKDKENLSIIGKGRYEEVHLYWNSFLKDEYNIDHIIRIDCRDGRIRVNITIQDYDITRYGGKFVQSEKFKRNPVHYHPFGPEEDEEMDECLIKLEHRIAVQFLEIKKAIDDGLTPIDNMNDW